MNTKVIKLDLNKRLYDKIIAKQDDTGSRFLLFQLFDGALPFNLANRSVRVYGVKPDGTTIFNDLTITHSATGFCLLELTNQMLAVAGIVKLELMITEEDKKLTTIPFELEVIKKINSNAAVESSNEFSSLLNALKEIEQWNREFADKSGKLEELYTPRLNELGEQLDTIEKYKVIQTTKLIEFFKSLMENLSVSITCRGDSMTYGQDTTSSDKRPADTTPTTNGTNHTFTRASVSYPEHLQTLLNLQYGKQVTVRNWGYSGDGTKQGLKHYPNASKSDLCVIMYGTNNATLTSLDDYNDVNSFITYYDKMIQLELKNNTPVVIMKPHKTKYPDSKTDRFTKALEMLASKYGIPILDLEREMINYKYDIYSDDIHYNANGYKSIALKLAIFILGGCGFNTSKVFNGTTLLTRKSIDNCLSDGVYQGMSALDTPQELESGKGIGTLLGTTNSITYYFETMEDDLIAIPLFRVPSTTTNVYCDYDMLNTSLQEPSLKSNVDLVSVSTQVFKGFGVGFHNYYNEISSLRNYMSVYIPVKGLHSIKFAIQSGGVIQFEGMRFVSYKEYYKDFLNPVGYYQKQLYDEYSATPSSVTSIRIKCEDISRALKCRWIGGNYFKATPMKLTLFTADRMVIEYGFIHVNTYSDGVNGGFKFLGELKRVELIPSVQNYRTITNITVDTSTNEYVITFGGLDNLLANITISPM